MRLLITILALVPILTFGQTENQTTIAKFTITDAKNNGEDMTPIILEADAYTVFYTSGDDGQIYMANVWPNSNSQSYGRVFGIKTTKVEETYDHYETDLLHFNWSYINDYNDKTGTAMVEVELTYKPQGVAFKVKIIP